MADVFIAYHEKSAGMIARKIADTLEKNGVSCWYAERDMKPEEFPGAITRTIRDCKIFLIVFNQEACNSRHMESELALAFRRIMNYENLTVLPFQIDHYDFKNNDALSYYLSRVQIIDGCPPDEEHIRDLAKRVVHMLGREKKTSASLPVDNARV